MTHPAEPEFALTPVVPLTSRHYPAPTPRCRSPLPPPLPHCDPFMAPVIQTCVAPRGRASDPWLPLAPGTPSGHSSSLALTPGEDADCPPYTLVICHWLGDQAMASAG